jgi:hypothetical protein
VKFRSQNLLKNKKFSLYLSKQFIFILGFVAALGIPNLAIAQAVSEVDQATSQWLAIERQANELKRDWKQQSPLLNQRILLLNAEKKQLEQLLSKKNENGNDVDIKREELLTEQTRIEQEQENMTKALALVRYTNNNISQLLPPVLKTQWQNQEAVDGEDNNTKYLQGALAQLTKLAEFNRRISTHESTIEVLDGQSILVQQLFLGASKAWFVTRDGQYAGWGEISDEGWEWNVDETVKSEDVKQAIAIFQKTQSADWVTLPIHLDTPIKKPKTLANQANKKDSKETL